MTEPKILIVDDQVQNLQLLVEVLSESNYDIMASKNPKDAIRIAQDELPDLILLDINMPEMDGFEVCKALKQDPLTRDLTIIFLSAQSSSVDEARALQLGAVDFIAKPFSVDIVKQRVKIHLELKNIRYELEECLAKQS